MSKPTLQAAVSSSYIANPAGSLKRRLLRHWQLYVIMLFPLANLIGEAVLRYTQKKTAGIR